MPLLRALLLLACLLFFTPARAAAPIVVGELLPLTGPQSVLGVLADRGATLAVEHRNAAGGIAGHPVRRVTADTQGHDGGVANAVAQLQGESVVAIVGEMTSSRTLAAASLAQTAGIPLITPSATNPAITQAGDHIFRASFLDPLQGTAMARFAVDEKLLRVAMLFDRGMDYSTALAGVFATALTDLGGRVVASETYAAGDLDFASQLRTLLAENPDALYVPGYYTEAALIARQARELGFQGRLLGGDGWDSAHLHEIGGEAVEGAEYTTHWAEDAPTPEARVFRHKFSARFGEPPDVLAALAYDAMNLVFAAMDRVAHEQPRLLRTARIADARDALARALAATQNVPGVTGPTSFGPDREVIKPVYVVRVTPTGTTWAATVAPSR